MATREQLELVHSPTYLDMIFETLEGHDFSDGRLVQLDGDTFAITVIWTAFASYTILKVAGVFGGLRVSEEHEVEGLDLSQHGERGYHNN